MTEVVTTEVAVGDQVRVHFHPPGPMRSFSERNVRWADEEALDETAEVACRRLRIQNKHVPDGGANRVSEAL